MSLTFMDIQIGSNTSEGPRRIVFRMYDTIVPKTVQNFKSLCIGDRGIGKTINKCYCRSNLLTIIRAYFIG